MIANSKRIRVETAIRDAALPDRACQKFDPREVAADARPAYRTKTIIELALPLTKTIARELTADRRVDEFQACP